jgi:peptidyl-prolyl cis-trans isomerase C
MSGRIWMFGGLVVAVALAWGVKSMLAQQPAGGPKPPAVVNGEPITQADLDAALRAGGPIPMQLTEVQRKQRQMQVLGGLIEQALMRQFLARNNVPVDTNEINRQLGEMAAGLKKQGKTIQEWCRDSNITEEQLRQGAALHVQWESYAKQHLTEADVEQFYKDSKDFFDRVTVRCSHILLRLPATATETERAQARARLTDLRAQILAGKVDFAEAAKAHSQCPTAERGGDLGFILRKWVVDETFARAAFALQPGQVSDVVETEFGLHLIKMTERKPGQPSEYTKIKEEVGHACIEDLRLNVLKAQSRAAKIEVNLQ